MILIASPKTGNIIIPNRTDRGMEISVIIAVRRFSRVRKITIMTTAPAMSSVSVPFSRDISMKSAWRYALVCSFIPLGSWLWLNSFMAASTACVSASVLAPGTFCTESTTASSPMNPASPRRGAPSIFTSATS